MGIDVNTNWADSKEWNEKYWLVKDLLTLDIG